MAQSVGALEKSTDLNKKIEELEKSLASPPPALRMSRSGIGIAVGLAGTPLIIFLGLFFLRPAFVLTPEKKGRVRDRKNLVRWTIVATLAAYGAAYLYACSRAAAPVSFSPEILRS